MIARRVLLTLTFTSTAALCFTLGASHARSSDALVRAAYDAKLDAIRAEVRGDRRRPSYPDVVPAGTSGRVESRVRSDEDTTTAVGRARMVTQIKKELQDEMGLMPVQLLRQRRSSFVELYSVDNLGKTNYGTAGYLGHGYFVTVKHGVVALNGEDDRQNPRKIVAVKIMYGGREIPARVVDA